MMNKYKILGILMTLIAQNKLRPLIQYPPPLTQYNPPFSYCKHMFIIIVLYPCFQLVDILPSYLNIRSMYYEIYCVEVVVVVEQLVL